jgi:signal transduction histidine kinase
MLILHLEDNSSDALLVESALRSSGLDFSYIRAGNRSEYVSLIESRSPDIILSDYRLPGFSGMAALELARQRCPEVPFIFVSGALGEETAIETLHKGATDYVLKDHIARLESSVRRALKEAAEHRQRIQSEESNRAMIETLRQSQSELRTLASHLLTVREEEATLMAREMHDELGQNLTALKMDAAWMLRRISALRPSDRTRELMARTESMSALLDAVIQKVRIFCAQLRPGILDELGLMSALEWQADVFQSRTDISCHLQLPDPEPAIDKDISTAMFRIFQEILNNVARHAAATKVDVKFEADARNWTLQVTDNGVGIDPSKIAHPSSIGLLGMKERAMAVGGAVEVIGSPREGTTVRVVLPFSYGADAKHAGRRG